MMELDLFNVPTSPERLNAVKSLLLEELTDRQRTLLLTVVLASTLSDEKIALLISGVKTMEETYHRAVQKLNGSK